MNKFKILLTLLVYVYYKRFFLALIFYNYIIRVDALLLQYYSEQSFQ